jgi:SAM-dependent methyltransferase
MSRSLLSRVRNLATDLVLGVSTRSIVETGIDDGKHCSTVDYALIDKVIDSIRLGASDVVVDVGCGLGRVVCSAARRPVREVVGIEGDAAIASRCEENVRRLTRRGWRRAEKVTIHGKLADDDALDSVWASATAYYLFCPFGEATLLRVAKKIRRLAERPVRIAYVNPAYESALREAGFRRTDSWPADPGRHSGLAVAFWESPRD